MTDPLAMLKVSTRKHTMTVLRDDDLYRHIRFQEPGTSIWHFDLVTWPGHLVITGDLEDFHFARVSDMFEFFRNPVGYINPGYWAEKLRGPVRTKSYSADRFKQLVFEHFHDAQDWLPRPHAPLWRAIRLQVLTDVEVYDESAAHRALQEFRFYEPPPLAPPVSRAQDFVPQYLPKASRRGVDFEFTDSWEWDLKEYDYHFLLSLHAIVWGIAQYDQAKRVAA